MAESVAGLRNAVRLRATGHCEYCLYPEEGSYYPFEVDHIQALKHGGETILTNLAWSCAPCNRYKGSDVSSIDPRTGKLARLFNPRSDTWADHFTLQNFEIVPLTATGRVTVNLLRLNTSARIRERRDLPLPGS